MRRLLLGCLIAACGCASVPTRPQDQAALAAADELVLRGCYDCLIEARAVYARLAVDRARPSVLPKLFEVDVLLALREKELAVDAAATEARAGQFAAELAGVVDVRRVLALVDLVPPEREGIPHRTLTEWLRAEARRRTVAELEGEVAWLEGAGMSPVLTGYLRLSVMCHFRRTGRFRDDIERIVDGVLDPAAQAPPVLRYRAATCTGLRATALTAVLADEPRFVEAHYYLGRAAVPMVQRRGNVADVRAPLEVAYGRFPQSPAVTYLNAQFNQLIGDCRMGLRFYDETLALWPQHENGLLGRAVCLTFLEQNDEAIRTATALIDMQADNRGEAYYWRAWNHWHLQALSAARRDIEAAKALRSNGDIHTLAGQIEHDEGDLESAETDLRTARSLSFGETNCTAAWYLGLVLMKKERWRETAETFEEAMRCYESRVAESEAGLTQIRDTPDLDEDFRARQIAGFEAAIREDRSQYHAAAFNAANHFVRAGDITRARPLVEIAAREPSLADLVRQLREYIKLPVRSSAA